MTNPLQIDAVSHPIHSVWLCFNRADSSKKSLRDSHFYGISESFPCLSSLSTSLRKAELSKHQAGHRGGKALLTVSLAPPRCRTEGDAAPTHCRDSVSHL